jgi:predicted DNA-binding transcriptional regulator YafY
VRRADRLFQIVQLLRRERAVTAAQLAAELEVSERTVYRDVQDLVVNGVPIQGEAGVGYALPASFDLPPLMFDSEEIQALVLGARMVMSWSDARLASAAKSALAKVEHVLPPRAPRRTASSCPTSTCRRNRWR